MEKDNEQLEALIRELKKKKEPIWKRLSKELARSTRSRRAVNLSRIEANIKAGETALVPGKVLSSGSLTKKATVAAYQFSEQAKSKIEAAGGNALTIPELVKSNAKKVRIIG